MKNSPLIGVLVGVVIVLLIVVFSLGYQVSKWNKLYSQEKKQKLQVSQDADELKSNVNILETSLNETKEELVVKKEYIQGLELELKKLEKLKEKLEDNLSEELIKQDVTTQGTE